VALASSNIDLYAIFDRSVGRVSLRNVRCYRCFRWSRDRRAVPPVRPLKRKAMEGYLDFLQKKT
jgi:hypothetical protein